jgi:hypothetical protein
MKDIILKATTDANGAATTLGEHAICGELYAVEYQPGTLATGATIILTCNGPNGSSKPLLTKASAGTANAWFYPRDLVHGVADGVALVGTDGGDRVCPLLNGVPKLVVAAGGSVLAGLIILYYED